MKLVEEVVVVLVTVIVVADSSGHGSCRSGCCSRRTRIKQKIPAEVGVMPCEIPVKRNRKVLLPRLPLPECFSKACLLLTKKYVHMLLS